MKSGNAGVLHLAGKTDAGLAAALEAVVTTPWMRNWAASIVCWDFFRSRMLTPAQRERSPLLRMMRRYKPLPIEDEVKHHVSLKRILREIGYPAEAAEQRIGAVIVRHPRMNPPLRRCETGRFKARKRELY